MDAEIAQVGHTKVLRLRKSGRLYNFPLTDSLVRQIVHALMSDDAARRHIMNAVAEARLSEELVEALANRAVANPKYEKVLVEALAERGFSYITIPELPVCAHEECELYREMYKKG